MQLYSCNSFNRNSFTANISIGLIQVLNKVDRLLEFISGRVLGFRPDRQRYFSNIEQPNMARYDAE